MMTLLLRSIPKPLDDASNSTNIVASTFKFSAITPAFPPVRLIDSKVFAFNHAITSEMFVVSFVSYERPC